MFMRKSYIFKLFLIGSIFLLNGCIMQRKLNSYYDIGLITDTSHYAVAIFENNEADKSIVKFNFAESNGYMILNLGNKNNTTRFKEYDVLNKLLIFKDNKCLNMFREYIDILHNKSIPTSIIEKSIIMCHPDIYMRDDIYTITSKITIPDYFTCCFVLPDGTLECKSTDNDIRNKVTRIP